MNVLDVLGRIRRIQAQLAVAADAASENGIHGECVVELADAANDIERLVDAIRAVPRGSDA